MPTAGELYAAAVGAYQQGQPEQAEKICNDVLMIDPQLADTHNLLGLLKRRRDDHIGALESFDRAAVLNPQLIIVHLNRGLTLGQLARWPEAEAAFEKALSLDPASGAANFHLGLCCHHQNKFENAVAHFRAVLRLDPNHANTLALLGMDLMLLGRLDEARASLEKALELRPDVATISDSLGILAETDGRTEEALHYFDRAVALDPNFAPARFNRAIALLRKGDLVAGLPGYEWRWRLPKDARAAVMRHFPQPLWTGEPLNDAGILVWLEQGLGDEIRSSALLRDLSTQTSNIVVECDPRLINLLSRSFLGVRFFPRTDPPAAELSDATLAFQVPADTLIRHLRPTLSAFPPPAPYLKADEAKRADFRRRLREQHGQKHIVGLSWRSQSPQFAAGKSMPLDHFAPLWKQPGIVVVDLQYGDTATERAACATHLGTQIQHISDVDLTNDIDATAALIGACDLVITVSNTTAHLAGALGVPTWVMLPFGHAQPWYWFTDRTDSPWYSSVTLYRPTKFNDWDNLVARVAKDLAQFTPPPRAPAISQ